MRFSTGLVLLVALAFLLAAQAARAALTCACVCVCDGSDYGKVGAVCLTDEQMLKHVKHVEMQVDRMGNHTNVKGVAVFRLAFDKHGRLDCAETVSGHPIAVSLLNASMERWRFKRFLRSGTAVRACGRVTLKFSVVEDQSTLEAVTPTRCAQGTIRHKIENFGLFNIVLGGQWYSRKTWAESNRLRHFDQMTC